MPVDVLAQPLAERRELADGDALLEVADVAQRRLPELARDHVAERVGGEVAERAAAQWTSWSTPWASSGTSTPM